MKFFQNSTTTNAAILLSMAALASRAFGIIRDRALAHTFGAGEVLDAYYVAFRIPDLLFDLIILGALSAGFIPVFTKLLIEKGKPRAEKLMHASLTIAALLLGGLGIILGIAAPKLVPLIAPGFNAETQELTITFTRIMMLSPLLLGISAVLGGTLQSLKRFVAFAIAPIFYNIGIIIGVLLLVPHFGNAGIAWGVVLGAFLHLIIQIIGVSRAGYSLSASITITHELIRIGYLMLPRTLGLAAGKINGLLLNVIASTLAVGSVASLHFANNITSFALGTGAISFAVAAFPVFTESYARHDKEQFLRTFSSTIRQMIFVLLPLTVIFILLRAQIVRVLLGTGAFTWEDTIMTFDTLGFIVLSLLAQGLVHVLARAFYAIENTKTPVIVALVSEMAVLGVAYFSSFYLGVAGIGLAISVGAYIQAGLLWLFLRRHMQFLDEKRILVALLKMTCAALVMALVMQALKAPIASLVDMTRFVGIATQASIVIAAGIATYLLVGLLLRSHEIKALLGQFKNH